nr:reverse transcriptase domain-containing protein [Tanacetum cinerariifolium]
MAGPLSLEGQDNREVTPTPLTKEQIEGHLSALRSIIKDHNRKNKTDPMQLDFDEEDITARDTHIVKGKEMSTNIKLYDETINPEDHLVWFVSAANCVERPMPVWCRMFQQTLDDPARGWFKHLPANSIDEWSYLREAFAARYSVRKACFKEPHEITKIVRRANESLTTFKERWTIETGFIMEVVGYWIS